MDVYIDQIQDLVSSTILKINQTTQSTENHKLIAITIIATVVLTKIYNILFDKISPLPLSHRIKHTVFTNVRKLPFIGTEIAKQVDKAKSDVHGLPTFQLNKDNENETVATYQTEICRKGRSEKDILNDLKVMSGVYDFGGDDGIGSENQKVLFSGSIYSGEKELASMWSKIFKTHCWSNPLHVDMFKSIRKMEAELIRQTINLYNGDQKACGIMTSGGTESIFQACVAYRNKYRKEHGWSGSVPTPELVLPVSAHPAFNKACHYLHVKVVPVEIDPVSKKVSVDSIRAKINSRTMAVVASAPQYPHGVFDPIEEIAGVAKSMGFRCMWIAVWVGFWFRLHMKPVSHPSLLSISEFQESLQSVATLTSTDARQKVPQSSCIPATISVKMRTTQSVPGQAGFIRPQRRQAVDLVSMRH